MKILGPSRSLCTRALSAVTISCTLFATAGYAQRLGTNVRPTHYSLWLSPDLKNATFSGIETIDIALAEPSSSITLNAVDLEFQSVTVTAGGKQLQATVSLDAEKEQATFRLPETIPAGKATLSIRYTGILNGTLRGFYLSKTNRRSYAVSQFESTDARRAFPCFDEPAFKATYDLSVTVDNGDTAISNSPIEKDSPGPIAGKHTVRFATTPKMSTYLVVILVGDFQCTAGEQDGVAIRVCSTPDKVALGAYSMEIAKYMLHYYNNYFGIPYPLKKLDLIAIPDFEAGAMENFGAITFRESTLLLDEKNASIGEKEQVAVDVAHEMAHQWFGDLVTMQWWDNTWLNEGFATWMENKSVAVMHPEWKMDQDVAADLDATLDLDAQPTTRTIRSKAETRDEIEMMFDGISYRKASHVLLMVENYEGQEAFRKGVHNYLAAHLYANATAEDFWNAQTAASGKPVDKIMESLVAQPGVPLLEFKDSENGKAGVHQKRFFLSPSIKQDSAQKWTLPVCFKTAVRTGCDLLSPDLSVLNVPGRLYFANAGGRGYYRSAYPPDVYAGLIARVETLLTPEERISLTGDEWAQVRANRATLGDYLNLVGALKADPNAAVISTALAGVELTEERVAATEEERDELAAWIRRTFGPELARLGPPKESESPNTVELRAELFEFLGHYGKDPAVIAEARQMAEKYLDDPASVEPTFGDTALAIAARNGDAALFDKLQKIFETSTNPEQQDTALRFLPVFENPALAERALNYAVSPKVRSQDALLDVSASLARQATRDIAWKFVQGHWDKVQPLLSPELGAYLVAATASFCSAEDRDSVQQFFTTHKVPAAENALKHAVERIDGCMEMRNLQGPNLKAWLAAQPKAQ
jgi:aminopeptidase N/puromycin-sensitive aminopeptidase